MPRNFFRRVETCFPIDESSLRQQVEQIIEIYWRDNVKAREQGADPIYRRLPAAGERFDAQAYFIDQIGKRKRTELEAKPVVLKVPKAREDEHVGQPA
jgi:polyphosphate kinase